MLSMITNHIALMFSVGFFLQIGVFLGYIVFKDTPARLRAESAATMIFLIAATIGALAFFQSIDEPMSSKDWKVAAFVAAAGVVFAALRDPLSPRKQELAAKN